MPGCGLVGESGAYASRMMRFERQSCVREAAMNVKAILAAKTIGRRHRLHRTDGQSGGGGETCCPQHRIGAVVIRGAGGRLAGILSERDIVRALSEHGAAALAHCRSVR